jgi:ParB family chromosome partitioning protein
MALIENVQRVDLNPIELASGYQRLIEECNYTQEQVADRVGKERSTITNLIRLLKLPEKVQEDLRVGLITIGHARSLLGLSSKSDIIALEKEILTKGLSVRQVERIVKDFQLGKVKFENNKIVPIVNKEKNDLQESLKIFLREKETNLQHRLGTKVSIKAKTEDTGVIEIEFYSKEEFERITEIMEQMQPSVKL